MTMSSGWTKVEREREVRAGLFSGAEAIPLEGVSVEAHLKDFAAKVTLSQRYVNRESHPIEAVYVFPLDEGAAVCSFEAVVDAVRVTGQAMEREKAFERYDDAMAAGHGAYLLDEERADVFTVSVGNLPPGKEATIRITTVAEMPADGDDIRFTLPTTVSPRYAPEADRKGVGQSPADALNPPVALQVPYGLDLTVTLEMPCAIRGVESPTHPLSFELDGSRGTVRLGERITVLDRDFVLKVKLEKPHAARAWIEHDPRGTAALLAFLPRLGESASRRRPCEAIFLVDRSGSMGGTSIQEARNALQLCLRSLDAGSRFNVVGFGSTFQKLFPESRPYDDASLAEATRYVAAMDADLGGTEILPALEAVLSAPAVAELPRQVFLLTDGEVTNTDEVISLAASHAPRARIFTFGIGAGASAHLVRGIARAGRGEAEFIAPGDRIEAKVVRQLSKALAPALTDIVVDWGGLEAIQAPHLLPPVFSGGRVLVYGFVKGDRPATVTLSAQGPDGPISESLVIDPAGGDEGDLIATLTARTLIRDLEEGVSPLHVRRGSQQERGQTGRTERVKEEIVRLGTTYSLASRETSFVAVEHRQTPLGEEAVLRKVPVALTHGWGGMMQAASMPMTPPAPLERTGAFARPTVLGAAKAFFDRVSAPPPAANAAPRQAESPEPSGSESLRPVDRLVALQRADGSWELTRELANLLGLKLRTLEKLLDAAAGDPEKARRALATSLALRWLNANASSERDEWALLAAKAQAWLDAANVRARDGRDVAELAAGLI
jgi:hypothetical protein